MYSLALFAFLSLVASSPTKSIDDTRIVGGEDIEITDAPYQISLMYRGVHTCGGALVAADIVITAAHCIMGSNPHDYTVRIGSSYHQRGGKLIEVGDLVWHPGFNFAKMDYDVAVLWLPTPVSFDVTAQPIDLDDADHEIKDGEITTVTGWGHIREGGGYPSVLQRVLVPKVNEAECIDAYSPLYTITKRMLCAGVPQGGKDSCQGDSGGPLIYNGKLAGVVSWGLGCARPEYPGVYTKISALRKWIDNNIAILRLRHVLRMF